MPPKPYRSATESQIKYLKRKLAYVKSDLPQETVATVYRVMDEGMLSVADASSLIGYANDLHAEMIHWQHAGALERKMLAVGNISSLIKYYQT